MNTNRREPLYLAHYIERAGTGTLDMIRLCREAGLPEPEFRHEGERFVVGELGTDKLSPPDPWGTGDRNGPAWPV